MKTQESGMPPEEVWERFFDPRAILDVMLFNILHAEARLEMLKEAARVLSADGQLAIIHWNYDPTTPRGPSMSIRPRASDCIAWAEFVGFRVVCNGPIDLPPYHYGILFRLRPFP